MLAIEPGEHDKTRITKARCVPHLATEDSLILLSLWQVLKRTQWTSYQCQILSFPFLYSTGLKEKWKLVKHIVVLSITL
jgi:hypothetical protein